MELEFERSGKWRSSKIKPRSSGEYMVKCFVAPDVVDQDVLFYNEETDVWSIGELILECIAWMSIPYPYLGSRAPGYC